MLGGQSMVYEMEEMEDVKIHFVLKGRISMLSEVMMRLGSICDLQYCQSRQSIQASGASVSYCKVEEQAGRR
jgi:hypothetical protein